MAQARSRCGVMGIVCVVCTLTAALFPIGCDSNIGDSQAPKKPPTMQPPPPPSDEDDAGAEPMMMGGHAKPDAGEDPEVVPIVPCRPLKSMEPANARSVVSSSDVGPTDRTVFTADLFGLFKSNCGGCHVDTNLGTFQVKDANSFAGATKSRQQLIHDRLHSEDPKVYMPADGSPNAKPWSQRTANDAVVELANTLDAWFAAGSPVDLFYVKNDDAAGQSMSPYVLRPEVASELTNIGNCIPDKTILAKEISKMDALDATFAAATELPARLDQTDLVTLDSEVLARNGVISFAPLYPLFSDNARKMRHVRVPRGESIVFDKETQEFTIPANTRVYKTFLKKIIEKDGSEHYRKIETRLILSRPDGPDAADGTHETHALFGTYAWNEDETEATLVSDPLRNGLPFRDRVVTYVTDEGAAQKVLDANPSNKVVALHEAGVTRSYAIPGSDRCVQCHMGSHNNSFLLGLTALQLNRRPMGEGGVIEPSSDDEDGQMQRLIDYGVVTGMASPKEVLPLEKAEGDRAPRNEHELIAQGYLIGNCSHCHNPRGFPTQQNPVLRDMLRFYPDRDGGIFQFPLDRVSPRIKRGIRQDVAIPYITPSLVDLEGNSGDGTYTPKHFQDTLGAEFTQDFIAAPWRSLIYRNVDTPFTYADDYALFPHMPMNSPGFDCRAPGIIGNWMISIPARIKLGEGETESSDANPQLYEEVKPDDPEYDKAKAAAQKRLDFYHRGGRAPSVIRTSPVTSFTQFLGYRYSDYCPDTSDIVAPEAVGTQLTPLDNSALPSRAHDMAPEDNSRLSTLTYSTLDGVPDRAHWVVTDITDPPGAWHPRRTDWAKLLVDKELDQVDERQKAVVEMLQTIGIDDAFRNYALEPVPFGLWKKKDGCNLSAMPKVSSFTGDARPNWMDHRTPTPKPDDSVYMQGPGATVFNEICINCHGPKFDSRGRMADTLMLITGGTTRVANLRDGLFGPVEDPGANRRAEFSNIAGGSADDWAVRYLAWMGLGGTQRVIPQMILRLVGTAQVVGDERPNAYDPAAKSANMLSIAQTLCSHTLGRKGAGAVEFALEEGRLAGGDDGTSLITSNGDAEHWQRLCGYQNPPPVRVVTTNGWQPLPGGSLYVLIYGTDSWYNSATYPTDALVGDHHGATSTGVTAGNEAPWCVLPPTDAAMQAVADNYVQTVRGGEPLPYCPASWLVEANKLSEDELERWTLKGAINAGRAVFVYLDKLTQDALQGKGPQPAYDLCEQLQ